MLCFYVLDCVLLARGRLQKAINLRSSQKWLIHYWKATIHNKAFTILKAGNSYHENRVKRDRWPKVRLSILMEDQTTSILVVTMSVLFAVMHVLQLSILKEDLTTGVLVVTMSVLFAVMHLMYKMLVVLILIQLHTKFFFSPS